MYDLVGVDGNAFAVMGYTARALRETGHADLVSKMREEATSSDYNHLLYVCMQYIDIANEGLEDDDYDDDDDWYDDDDEW